MAIAFIAFSIYLFIVSLCGAIYTRAPRHVYNLSFVYYGFSLFGHLLVLPLLIITLFMVARADALWLDIINTVSAFGFALIMWQGYRGHRQLNNMLPGRDRAPFSAVLMGWVLPFKVRRKGVKRIADVAYGKAGGVERFLNQVRSGA